MEEIINQKIKRVEGSFRDPAGSVYKFEKRIFREIKKEYLPVYKFIKEKNIYQKHINNKYLLKFEELDKSNYVNNNFDQDSLILESLFLDTITYPYEWGFDQLRECSNIHLNFNLELLKDGFTLKDASPYNVNLLTQIVFLLILYPL